MLHREIFLHPTGDPAQKETAINGFNHADQNLH